MAIFKCKMCGGDLNIDADINVVECEYCGTTQTVPTADNEKKMSLFTRANKLRFACDFDKAAGVYESIVTEFPEEAEAYWGLILCKYGIEYVDDPGTGKKIPTCHRSSFDCILDDSDFEMVMENADSVARKVYRDEAKAIEELRKAIIEISGKEEPYDIFICYKETAENGDRTIDSVIAQDVYDELTAKGYRVFFSRITLEDKLGQEYEPYIFAALNSAKVMLAFGTDYEYYNAVWVKNEWSRFLQLIAKGEKKTLIPCYKNIDAYDMPKEFAKLQAQDMGKVGAVQDLLRGIEKIIPKNEPVQVKETVVVSQSGGPNVEALLKRGNNALEDGNFADAKTHFDKVLDIDAECAEAYLGLAMADERVKSVEELINRDKTNSNYYKRAKQYANNNLREKIKCLEKEKLYADAVSNKNNAKTIADYLKVAKQFETLGGLKDSEELAAACIIKAKEVKELLANKRVLATKLQKLFASNIWQAVGLKTDGTLITTSYEFDCNDVIAVSTTQEENIVLKSDGTVYCDEEIDEEYGEVYHISDWENISEICGGLFHIVALKKDGTVLVTGESEENQTDVSCWENIISVSAGYNFSVGLTKNGTVLATGMISDEMEKELEKWHDIVAVSCGQDHILGLKSDGTVVATGYNENGQCNVSEWCNIVSLACGENFSFGLTLDGTVVATKFIGSQEYNFGQCNVSDWKNIVAISAGVGVRYSLGLRSDGTVVATGYNKNGQCKVDDWKLFDHLENLDEERKREMEQKHIEIVRLAEEKRIAEEKAAEEKRRIEEQKAAYRQQGVCQHCGGTFKGLFTKKCTVCGEVKDY